MIYKEKKSRWMVNQKGIAEKKVIMEFSHMLLMEHELNTNETIKSEWMREFLWFN